MVSKKLLNEYGFSTIEEYYNMVAESKINGNFSQTLRQLKKIERKRQLDFLVYIENNYGADLYSFFLAKITGN